MITKEEMIRHHLQGRDIRDPEVIRAMKEVDRKAFVPEELKPYAYEDGPLPIGRGQTISQPYIVAYMAQHLDLKKEDVILEIGSGCGYNAAVLSRLVTKVYSIEIIKWLAELARTNLEKAGIKNVCTRYGDGHKGWPEKAPFDKIILTASTPNIPESLKEQLKISGRLMAPVSNSYQNLVIMEKKEQDEFCMKELIPVRFVPMTQETESWDG
ncbi:MAG: protein-L-isoaspartate(D-aspartate) O-methyltransferase [Bacteroidales bacterium]